MSSVLDGEELPASPAQIAATPGIAGVMQYVAPQEFGWPKALTPARLQDIVSAKLPVAFNYETDGKSWRGGYNQGLKDGQNCQQAMNELGLPAQSVYYSPADEDVNESGFGLLAQCIAGFNAGRALNTHTDAYLTHAEADYCRQNNLINRSWQINARGWYGNQTDDPNAALIQHTTHSFPFPANLYDESTLQVAADAWGAYPASAPPHPQEELEMFLHRMTDDPAYHAVYLNNGINYRWLESQAELDTWLFLLKQDPATIGSLSKAQIGNCQYVGKPAT